MRRESLSVEGIGTCCSATSLGSEGGGRDWVPDIGDRYQRDAILESCVEQLNWIERVWAVEEGGSAEGESVGNYKGRRLIAKKAIVGTRVDTQNRFGEENKELERIARTFSLDRTVWRRRHFLQNPIFWL